MYGLLGGAILAIGVMAMAPWAWRRTKRTGIDFPIYYLTGTVGKPMPGFVYSDLTIPAWRLLARLRYDDALALMTGLTMVAAVFLYAAICGMTRDGLGLVPIALALLWIVSYSVRHGNITTICAALCLHPVGTLVAGCYKPHLLLFLVLHVWVGSLDPVLWALLGFGIGCLFWPEPAQIRADMEFHERRDGRGRRFGQFGRYILRKDNAVYLVTAWVLVMR